MGHLEARQEIFSGISFWFIPAALFVFGPLDGSRIILARLVKVRMVCLLAGFGGKRTMGFRNGLVPCFS